MAYKIRGHKNSAPKNWTTCLLGILPTCHLHSVYRHGDHTVWKAWDICLVLPMSILFRLSLLFLNHSAQNLGSKGQMLSHQGRINDYQFAERFQFHLKANRRNSSSAMRRTIARPEQILSRLSNGGGPLLRFPRRMFQSCY